MNEKKTREKIEKLRGLADPIKGSQFPEERESARRKIKELEDKLKLSGDNKGGEHKHDFGFENLYDFHPNLEAIFQKFKNKVMKGQSYSYTFNTDDLFRTGFRPNYGNTWKPKGEPPNYDNEENHYDKTSGQTFDCSLTRVALILNEKWYQKHLIRAIAKSLNCSDSFLFSYGPGYIEVFLYNKWKTINLEYIEKRFHGIYDGFCSIFKEARDAYFEKNNNIMNIDINIWVNEYSNSFTRGFLYKILKEINYKQAFQLNSQMNEKNDDKIYFKAGQFEANQILKSNKEIWELVEKLRESQ